MKTKYYVSHILFLFYFFLQNLLKDIALIRIKHFFWGGGT